MDQADGAIATARAAGAAQYASAEFSAAETALRRSHEAADQRDYRQALNHALDARERAQTAAREAADRKAQVRGQAERGITAAELALATAQQRLQAVSSSPGPRRPSAAAVAALQALRADVERVEASLQEARTHLQAQRFDEASAVASPLPERIRAATATYDAAVAAIAGARGGRRTR